IVDVYYRHVDENIPVTSRKAEKTIALVISNENYKQVTDVESALNDGETFAKYCTMTLGIPESQVMTYENVTYAEMLGAMQKLKQLAGALGDGVDIIVYYAGHGFPDEGNKDAYLLPVDGDGFTTATSYPLKKLYSDLSGMGADNVMVFLDACFSGATRDGGMLAEARGVALKPRVSDPEGNMFVLSAASDQETALPYREKNHGLFTYYLLKKIQDTKGNVTLQDLSRYVEDMVKKNSLTVNRKLQTPRTSVSGRMKDNWTSKRLRQ
ncbi:MAG: caspase family protein, partial [Muribaculaceae bacterium]|nr:caspase family protein [Muribaculaceae bacterium]